MFISSSRVWQRGHISIHKCPPWNMSASPTLRQAAYAPSFWTQASNRDGERFHTDTFALMQVPWTVHRIGRNTKTQIPSSMAHPPHSSALTPQHSKKGSIHIRFKVLDSCWWFWNLLISTEFTDPGGQHAAVGLDIMFRHPWKFARTLTGQTT